MLNSVLNGVWSNIVPGRHFPNGLFLATQERRGVVGWHGVKKEESAHLSADAKARLGI